MGCAVFTDAEYRYLAARQHARLVSIGPGDAPQIHPVSFSIDALRGWIDIGGPRLRDSQKYRNIRRDPRVTLFVDDESASLQGSGLPSARNRNTRRGRPFRSSSAWDGHRHHPHPAGAH